MRTGAARAEAVLGRPAAAPGRRERIRLSLRLPWASMIHSALRHRLRALCPRCIKLYPARPRRVHQGAPYGCHKRLSTCTGECANAFINAFINAFTGAFINAFMSAFISAFTMRQAEVLGKGRPGGPARSADAAHVPAVRTQRTCQQRGHSACVSTDSAARSRRMCQQRGHSARASNAGTAHVQREAAVRTRGTIQRRMRVVETEIGR
jgi:hypothetical protein